jgi:monoamine oxidase
MSHIIIIGSGASGLMSARMLAEKSHKVTVVEARDRIGGRIHKLIEKFTRPVQAGAEFIHGDQSLTLALLREAQGEAMKLNGKHYTLNKGELERGDLMDDQWDELTQALNTLTTDTDMASFLDKHFKGATYQDLRDRVHRFTEGFDTADIHRVSALALREEWSGTDEEHQYHIRDGYSSLMEYLAEKIKHAGGTIILSSPVREIEWRKGYAKVTTDSGASIEGDKIIVTVPLGVLQKGTIRFTPDLAAHRAAFQAMGFGGVIKFLFEFNEPFWENHASRNLKNLAFLFSDADIPTWWTQLPDKTPLLTGWFGGPRTFNAHHQTNALFSKAISSLQYIFKLTPADIQSRIHHWHIADWTQDLHTHGAYAYATVETTNALALVTKPIQDTIYFAGEAMYAGPSMGTVEAALTSGRETAERIV